MTFVTLVVRDLRESRQFYVEGPAGAVEFEAAEEVVMIRVGEKVIFSLWQEGSAVEEIGRVSRGEGVLPFTLAHNVATSEDVDRVIAEAAAAASVVSAPSAREWGGYSGYFADPDGFRWEVAHNPGPIGQSVL